MGTWQVQTRCSGPHRCEAISKPDVVGHCERLAANLAPSLLTWTCCNTNLIITGDELAYCVQYCLSCELPRSLGPLDHPIKGRLGLCLRLFQFLHLFPDRSRDGMVILRYVQSLAPLLVNCIMLTDMSSAGRVSTDKESLADVFFDRVIGPFHLVSFLLS
jgi:hypothetical protein